MDDVEKVIHLAGYGPLYFSDMPDLSTQGFAYCVTFIE